MIICARCGLLGHTMGACPEPAYWLGSELFAGDRVHIESATGVWTVLPLDDGLHWLGRGDGALIPIIPDDCYELATDDPVGAPNTLAGRDHRWTERNSCSASSSTSSRNSVTSRGRHARTSAGAEVFTLHA